MSGHKQEFFAAYFSGVVPVFVPLSLVKYWLDFFYFVWLRISCLSLPFSFVEYPKPLWACRLLSGGAVASGPS